MGARLGRYVVLKHLASGGMADVLLGRADGVEGFERHVVLKRIRPDRAGDQRFIRMFLDEARVAATLHHQHVVQVHDVGEVAGEYFIAMEYIHGEDVRTILAGALRGRQHVPLGYAMAIVSAAAAGLHYAHERRGPDKRPLGIVHRDISPSNILVGYDGSIKVVDFGIAKAELRQETRSGSLKGKVAYMSPEQCKSGEVDRRSDVYSLGVVLYELATTTKLFRGENDYLVMDQIVNGRVPPPRARRPDLPHDLSAIILRAIATDPDRRFATADEFRLALDQFAIKVGLTATTSAIAAYMRKQFGEKPEPWVDLDAPMASLDVPGAVASPAAPGPSGGWQQLWVSPAHAAALGPSPVPEPITPVGSAAIRAGLERATSITAPTDSKMGWESQRPEDVPRRFSWGKLAIVSAPAIAVLIGGLWWLGNGDSSDPASAAPQPPPPAMPALETLPLPPSAVRAAPAPEVPHPTLPPTLPATETPIRPAAMPSRGATSTDAPGGAGAAPHDGDRRSHKDAAKVIESPSSPSGTDAPRATAPAAAPQPPPAPAASPATAPATSTGARPHAASDTVHPTSSPAGSSTLIATLPGATPAAATVSGVPQAMTPEPAAIPAVALARPAAAPPSPRSGDDGLPTLTHTVIDRVASDHTRELSKCDGGEAVQGAVTVRFAVDAGGKVTKAQVATAGGKPKVAACILRSVQKWQFPPQATTGAQGTYTLSFQ